MSKTNSDSTISTVQMANLFLQIVAAVMKVYKEQTGKQLDLSSIKLEPPL